MAKEDLSTIPRFAGKLGPTPMAPPVTPVAPVEETPVAVAPVAVAPTSNVIPIKQDGITVKTTKVNDADLFESAVDNGDAKALYSLTTSFDPRVSEAARDKVAVIQKSDALVNALAPINTNTAQGRMDIAQVYQTLNNRDEAKAKGWTTIQDSPQVGTALLRFVMGDKVGALNQITGGNVKAETEYDDQGKMLIVNRNELGQIDSIFDPDGKMISRQEYAARGGSRELEKTLARKRQIQMQEENVKTYLKDTEKNYKAASALTSASTYSREMSDLAKDFTDLDAPTKTLLAGFNTNVLNFATSVNNTVQTLNQVSSTKGQNISAGTIKDIKNATGTVLGTVWSHVDGDQFSNGAGQTASASELASRMSTASSSKNIERIVNQTRNELAKQIRIAQTTGAPAERITQLAKLDRYFDLAEQREKIYADNKANLPAFAQIPTSLPNITDQASRLKLNAVQGEYAAAQVTAFNKWKDEELKKERAVNTNFVPEPGRYEAQWVKQDEFKRLEKEFRDQARVILNEMPKLAKPVDVKALPAAAAIPDTTASNSNEAKVGAAPPKQGSLEFLEDNKQDFKPKIKRRK
jgi:uncharacterized protein YcfJ